jgi:putative ABC transport system permease protein
MAVPVALGVATVIGAFGIASSARADLNDSLRRLGANHILVTPSEQSSTGEITKLPATSGSRAALVSTVTAVGELTEQPGHSLLPAVVSDPLSVATATATVFGAGTDLLDVVDVGTNTGRFLNDFDESTAARVVVVGDQLARSFAIEGDGLRSMIIDGELYGVVGVLEPVSVLPQLDRSVLLPATTAVRQWGDDGRPTQLVVAVEEGTAQQTADVLPRIVSFGAGSAPLAQVASDLLIARGEINDTLGIVVAASGGLALVLAGVGIAFAMSAAVLQRTSEIGIRRAVGASRRDITYQFLLEAAAVGVVGGLLGSALGVGVVVGVAQLRQWPVQIDPVLAVAATFLALELTLAAGLAPARRAAKLDPMSALRS